MRLWKSISEAVKYFFLAALISLQILSIRTAAAKYAGGAELAVTVWRASLLIVVTVGLMGNFFAMDVFSKLVTGRRQSFLGDLMESDSAEMSESYNGLIVSSLALPVLVTFEYLYFRTNIRLFLVCCYLLAIAMSVSVIVRILALYIKTGLESGKTLLSRLLDPIMLPSVIGIFLVLVTNDKTVGFVYGNLRAPAGAVFRVLALIIVLCYIPAAAFCHYSNLYCITALAFARKDPEKIKGRLAAVEKREAERGASLRQIAKYVDEMGLKAGFFKKIGLAVRFFRTHISAYWRGNVYAAQYLLLCGRLRLTRVMGGLLDGDRIRTHMIRFCEITVVLELLALNILLFMYLEENDPCSRFFELLSTVVIIPILLSSLSGLKTE